MRKPAGFYYMTDVRSPGETATLPPGRGLGRYRPGCRIGYEARTSWNGFI